MLDDENLAKAGRTSISVIESESDQHLEAVVRDVLGMGIKKFNVVGESLMAKFCEVMPEGGNILLSPDEAFVASGLFVAGLHRVTISLGNRAVEGLEGDSDGNSRA